MVRTHCAAASAGCWLRTMQHYLKIVLSSAAIFLVVGQARPQATPAVAEAPAQTAPAAGASQEDRSQEIILYQNAHPYLDDAIPDLERKVPELKGLNAESDAPPDLWAKFGSSISEMVNKVPSLAADEEIDQTQRPNGTEHSMGCMRCPGNAAAERRESFNYLMLIHETATGKMLEEDRTETRPRPDQPPLQPFFRGFVQEWIAFWPGNRSEAHFRYLGEQKIQGRRAFVVAYAQVPGAVPLPGQIQVKGRNIPLLLQGVAWIDSESYQILQLRTDLLEPQLEIDLLTQTSEIRFGPVRIPTLDLTLWLPKNVNVESKTTDDIFDEQHSYSKYHLYQATARILVAPNP